MKILIWGNTSYFNFRHNLLLALDKELRLYEVKSYLEAVHTLKDMSDTADVILAFVKLSDFESLYRIQQLQKDYSDIPLVAVFDTGYESVAINSLNKIISTFKNEKSYSTNSVSFSENKTTDGHSKTIEKGCCLTPRQTQVLKLLVDGKSNKQIARDLKVSEGTVKLHCVAIYKEIGAVNRTQAAIKAEPLIRMGFI